jgi:hypothetical protein
MWTEFWFESNAVFQMVRDRADWEQVEREYREAYGRDIYQCRRNIYQRPTDRSVPNFGLRMEHLGDETLGMFFDRHGMSRN